MIDLNIVPEVRERAARRAAELDLVIPTFAQMRSPELVPDSIRGQLARIGLWDLHPANLFRVTWRNQPVSQGGGFGGLNYLEFPPELTGTEARVAALVGKWFPTGAHKVGAAFGCLAPRLVTGQFDPTRQLAAWPSTGNYCRGGAYDSRILSCRSIAILPEGMSRERFDWLDTVADEVIATPGSESNVKEIFDKCWELRRSGRDIVIFNQFDEFGNYLWHYSVTGPAFAELAEELMGPGDRLAGVALTTGSSGTLASGDYLKEQHPHSRIAAAEALQCPTMLRGGFGEHRIEGIGDKHIPWIHNVRNTDMVVAIDDAAPLGLIRLFNEPAGRGLPGRVARGDREPRSVGYLGGGQSAVGHQDGQMVRVGAPRPGTHHPHRLHGSLSQPAGGTHRCPRGADHRRCGGDLSPLPAGRLHRSHGGVDLSRAPAHS